MRPLFMGIDARPEIPDPLITRSRNVSTWSSRYCGRWRSSRSREPRPSPRKSGSAGPCPRAARRARFFGRSPARPPEGHGRAPRSRPASLSTKASSPADSLAPQLVVDMGDGEAEAHILSDPVEQKEERRGIDPPGHPDQHRIARIDQPFRTDDPPHGLVERHQGRLTSRKSSSRTSTPNSPSPNP